MYSKIIFRLDAGKSSGFGHLSRNLVLAEEFSKRNCHSKFLIRTDSVEKTENFIHSRVYNQIDYEYLPYRINPKEEVEILSFNMKNADNALLIIDHYRHNFEYFELLFKKNIKWAQFDYFHYEEYLCNFIINPNIGVFKSDYIEKKTHHAELLVGLDYAIINRCFLNKELKGNREHVLFAMGGGEYPAAIMDLMKNIIDKSPTTKFVIVTSSEMCILQFEDYSNVVCYNNPSNIAELYSKSRLGFVSGGVSTYELAFLNTPLVVFPFAENQMNNAELFMTYQLAKRYLDFNEFLNELNQFGIEAIIDSIRTFVENTKVKIDGNGANRMVDRILKNPYIN